MDAENVPVHWWTRDWWRTLPDAYRAADAVQTSPPQLSQVGLNAQPLFLTGVDGWQITNLGETATHVSLRFRRSFFGTDMARQLFLQLWWTADTTGSNLSFGLTDATGQDLGSLDFTDLPEGDGEDTIAALLTTAEPITATILLTAPKADEDLLFSFRAVNIGYRTVAYEELTSTTAILNHPLLRYMEGVGRIAGEIRDISDGMWSGHFMKPENIPDTALRWVAQMMGVSATIRNQPIDGLRAYLVNLAENGRPASGTRADINSAAKKYLTGTKQTVMVPSPTQLHTLIMLVREDELPGADVDTPAALAALVAAVRATGVVPAGHQLIAQVATPSWDEWMAAAGVTWTEREANARTWTESDSLGVTITE
jgi:hypothetical protein